MFEESLFNETNYPHKHTHSHQTESIYSPWNEEYHDYMRHPTQLRKQQRLAHKPRYLSEMDSYTSKSRVRSTKIKDPKDNNHRISIQKAVTIEYEDDQNYRNKNKENQRANRIRLKLPTLTPKKTSKKQEHPSADKSTELLKSNNRNSLKKYVHNPRTETPPMHFQIYKRSIVAARKSLAINPERSLDLYNNI